MRVKSTEEVKKPFPSYSRAAQQGILCVCFFNFWGAHTPPGHVLILHTLIVPMVL